MLQLQFPLVVQSPKATPKFAFSLLILLFSTVLLSLWLKGYEQLNLKSHIAVS